MVGGYLIDPRIRSYMPSRTPHDSYSFIGGELCLDFINTLGGMRGKETKEYLQDYNDLVNWASKAKIILPEIKDELVEGSRYRASMVKEVYQRSLEFRECLYRVLESHLEEQYPNAEDMEIINSEQTEANKHLKLVFDRGGYSWRFDERTTREDFVLWLIVHSACRLLTSDLLGYLKICGSSTCGWMFLDQSKNKSRRWCEMKTCGNRTKQKSFRTTKAI